MYEYRVKILRIVDGDTVDVDIDLGFGVWMHRERIRLWGIDTPESRTKDPIEKVFGNYAKDYVKDQMPIGSMQTMRTQKDKEGKYGRILGEFIMDGVSMNKTMVDKHIAVGYSGQSKDDVEAEHLANREHLLENGTINRDDITGL
tara:strand:- start:264 stop:698 length:435 start_codon:yes stop_codon:yes gene_type:complete